MTFRLHRGDSPLLVSMPHIGTQIPADLHDAYSIRALSVEDTDWHLDLLYDFLDDIGASVIKPCYSRYVIDLNRPPDDAPMYPGASNTELCPTRFFTGDPLYKPGREPDLQERARRRQNYWAPYHQALATELERIRAQHGYALLWDAHSIRSELPWLFEGILPGLNIGTAGGTSADTSVADAVVAACAGTGQFSHVLNGRFKGGYITRHYGDPQSRIHAVQLEMCRFVYMREDAPFVFEPDLARAVQPQLRNMICHAMAACQKLYER